MSAVVVLLVCFLSCSVSEEPQEHQIIAKPGDDTVTLSCRAPNVNITVVKWIISNPERYVYLKRDGHLMTADQDPSYVNRVQLKDDVMKNGELSLILKNVKSKDGGAYVCSYVEKREGAVQMKLISIVHLNVEERQITAHRGYDVTLPCRAPYNAIITAVEWVRSNLDPDRYVYLKEGGRLNTADQDPSFVNRVQLKDDVMRNGDLSLILKNANSNDEGTYECRYEERGGWKRGGQIKLVVIRDAGGGDSRDGKHGVSPLLVSLIVGLVVLLFLCGCMIYMKLKGRSEKKPDLPDDDPDVLQQLQEN